MKHYQALIKNSVSIKRVSLLGFGEWGGVWVGVGVGGGGVVRGLPCKIAMGV